MSWVKTAKAGDKVVCVDNEKMEAYLQRNHVYTIKQVAAGLPIFCDGIGLEFTSMPDLGFCWCRFKPVQHSKASTASGMTILRKLLKTKKQDA